MIVVKFSIEWCMKHRKTKFLLKPCFACTLHKSNSCVTTTKDIHRKKYITNSDTVSESRNDKKILIEGHIGKGYVTTFRIAILYCCCKTDHLHFADF